MIDVTCPDCGKEYTVDADKLGLSFACRSCEGTVTVAEATSEPPLMTDWSPTPPSEDAPLREEWKPGDTEKEAPLITDWTPQPQRDEFDHGAERDGPAVPPGSRRGTFLVVFLGLLIVGGLAAGAYYLFWPRGASGPRAESIGYITDDADWAVVVHPRQFIESDLVQSQPRVVKMIREFEEKNSDVAWTEIEQILFFSVTPEVLGGNFPMAGNWGAAVRFRRAVKPGEAMALAPDADETTTETESYKNATIYRWADRDGAEKSWFGKKFDLRAWFPDSHTMVLGDSRGIRKIIDGDREGRKTRVGKRLARLPMKSDVIFVGSLDNSRLAEGLRMIDTKQRGVANILAKIRGVVVKLTITGKEGSEFFGAHLDFADERTAEQAELTLGVAIEAMKEEEKPLKGLAGSPEELKAFRKMLRSGRVTIEGKVVKFSFANPGMMKIIGDRAKQLEKLRDAVAPR